MKMGASPDAGPRELPHCDKRTRQAPIKAAVTGGEQIMKNQNVKRIETMVIGGGQAGLSVGYHLAKRGMPFQIVDANEHVGDAWRNRWDSLRLFTPARYSSLPGLPFPARGDAFPTKQQMASYLETYAKRFKLPIQTGAKVNGLAKAGDRFIVTAGDFQYEADNVVVAMGNYQQPRTPEFARDLDPSIVQLHSHEYRNPSQLQEGGVLVVGVGNSGADIGMEVARTHPTWLSGKESGHIPWPIESFMGRNVMIRLIRFVGHHVLTLSTPIGRRLRPKLLTGSAPLIRVKPKDLERAGIERVPKVVGVKNGQPLLADNRTLDVKNVIWCTGFTPGFSWIDVPIFGEDRRPMHERGVVHRAPGLYFVGLHYLYSMTSDTVTGVGRDAERIVKAIEVRTRMRRAA
jgi:putative flavoprotein involved in K+ transport